MPGDTRVSLDVLGLLSAGLLLAGLLVAGLFVVALGDVLSAPPFAGLLLAAGLFVVVGFLAII